MNRASDCKRSRVSLRIYVGNKADYVDCVGRDCCSAIGRVCVPRAIGATQSVQYTSAGITKERYLLSDAQLH